MTSLVCGAVCLQQNARSTSVPIGFVRLTPMANRALDPATRKKFWSHLQQGYSVAAASRECGIAYQTGLKWANGDSNPGGKQWREQALYRQLPEPIKKPLGDAGDCLKD